VDPLRRATLDEARRTTPEQRARQTLELMQTGYRLKRAALRARHPDETQEELEARFRAWLEGDDGT
jgi:uncharacterized protein YaeQ